MEVGKASLMQILQREMGPKHAGLQGSHLSHPREPSCLPELPDEDVASPTVLSEVMITAETGIFTILICATVIGREAWSCFT